MSLEFCDKCKKFKLHDAPSAAGSNEEVCDASICSHKLQIEELNKNISSHLPRNDSASTVHGELG